MRLTLTHIKGLKVAIWISGLLPLVWLYWALNNGALGADPAKDIQHITGDIALKFLLATLLISPLSRYFKQPFLMRCRRLCGLWCFTWASLHLASYYTLELGLNHIDLLGQEILHRPYLLLGMISWLILFALAVTSTQKLQRKLGPRWQTLHNFIYVVAILIPIHAIWSLKVLSPWPVLYAVICLILLSLRYKKLRFK